MKWLVVGANGQLGRSITQRLKETGADFLALGRDELDITNSDQVQSIFSSVRSDVVVNTAAWTNVDLAEDEQVAAGKINIDGPENLAKAARSIGAKFIHFSTDYVFSGFRQGPWPESADKFPASVYGKTKSEGEDRILSLYSENTFVVRTAWLYGPFGRNFAKTMLNLSQDPDRIVEVVNDQIGQPTYSLDLADRAMELVKNETPPGIYHGTNSGSTSWYGFAREIFKAVGSDPDRVVAIDSSHIKRKATRPTNSVLGQTRWSEAGMEPMRDWRLALDDAIPLLIAATSAKE